jgi:hypothetical protein
MECPNCGAEVPPKARACPECGSDEQTGWSEEAQGQTGNLGLPNEDFDYDEFVKKEFEEKQSNPVPHGIHWFWWLVAIGIVVVFVLMWI